MLELLNDHDRGDLKERIANAIPFPFIMIDNFLQEDFANEIHDSFPSYEKVSKIGRSYKTVNESGKFEVTNPNEFSEPIKRLNTFLASKEFLDFHSEIMGIPNLLADDKLEGGGIHQTGPRGKLDVHIDFNYIEDRQLHRRTNILIYFNKDWEEGWGGNVEIWDKDVKKCHGSFSPIFNRAVMFATSNISFHGVTAVNCPEGISRKSFAGYYYTKVAPPYWTGEPHSTIFKARPSEKLKGAVLMPAEKLITAARKKLREVKSGLRKSKSR